MSRIKREPNSKAADIRRADFNVTSDTNNEKSGEQNGRGASAEELKQRQKRWQWAQEKLKFKACYCEEIIKNAEEGKSFNEFAASICVSRATLYKWKDTYAEFGQAMQIAKEKYEAAWWDMAKGEMKKNFHFGIWKFVMTSVFGYG